MRRISTAAIATKRRRRKTKRKNLFIENLPNGGLGNGYTGRV